KGNAETQPAADSKSEKTTGKEKEQATKQDASTNPLSRFVKKILPGAPAESKNSDKPAEKKKADTKAKAGREKPGSARGDSDEDDAGRDHIDSRAPQDANITKAFRRAAGRVEEQDWVQALELLKGLLDPPAADGGANALTDSLIRLPDGRWVSVRGEAQRLVGQLPGEYLQRYRREMEPKAAVLLKEAEESKDLQQMVAVATRFFHTEAGQRAANYLGTYHFDRGEFGMAAHWFGQLVQAKATASDDPKWRVKAAFAMRQAGREREADTLISSGSSAGSMGELELGGTRIQPQDWLKTTQLPPLDQQQLEDWRMAYGSPSRTGTAQGGEPLLLPRWTAPVTYSKSVLEQMETLIEDLRDLGQVPIPTLAPITVDGKVVFRTLRGVQVVDAATGDELWATREGVSPEQVLTGQPADTDGMNEGPVWNGRVFGGGIMVRRGRMFAPGMVVDGEFYSGQGAEAHPLTNLLFRDGIYGSLSSDGEQLFVIEDHAVLSQQPLGYSWDRQGVPADPFRRSWTSNRLTSYDLNNGRTLWDVGGREMNEPFDPPLAGTYFFGAPVPDAGELLVVGEKNNEIRLFGLDAQLGSPLWSQLIAYSDAPIDQDLARRWFTSQISVGNGVIVCPTTVGWLVAVDRLKHTVLWAHRYTSPTGRKEPEAPNATFVQPGRLNGRWSPSAPVIVGNRVVYTPSEEQLLICLNLFDGTRIWKKSKGSGLYLAGVFGESVVVVGTRSVVAYSLSDGTTVWSAPIPADEGTPSGFGVAVGSHYYLPLNSGQLWTIDLADGHVLSKLKARETLRPMGNLAMARGMLISQDALGVTAFEQREMVESEIKKRQEGDPVDFAALMRQAEIHALNREHPQALAALHKIDAAKLPAEQSARYRSAMIEGLTAFIRSDLRAHDAEMEELAKLATTADEKNLARRLAARRLEERGALEEAFNLYWEIGLEHSDSEISRDDNSHIAVNASEWVAGKLADVWAAMPDAAHAKLSPKIAAAAEKASAGDRAVQRQFIRLFGFHPQSVPVMRKLVEQYAAGGEFLSAEILLLKLGSHSDAAVAADATARLARLLQEQGLPEDAAVFLNRLLDRFPDAKLASGMTGREHVEKLRAQDPAVLSQQLPPLAWGNVDVRLESSGTGYDSDPVSELDVGGACLPFFRKYRAEIQQNQQRLNLVNARDESIYWMLPLRLSAGGAQLDRYPAQASAHQLVLLHRDVLHCLSPVEKKVVWTLPLEVRGEDAANGRIGGRQPFPTFISGSRIQSRQGLRQQDSVGGLLAVANNNYLCVYGRRSFTVLDAATGKFLWRCGDVAKNTRVYGTEDVLFVLPQARNEAVALRARDGKKLAIDNVAQLISNSIYNCGKNLVQLDTGLGKSVMALSSKDPLTGKVLWTRELPSKANLALLDDGHLAVLDQPSSLRLIDLETGREQPFEFSIPLADVKSSSDSYAVADADVLYLVFNQRRQSRQYPSHQLPTLSVNGVMAAFDRRTGKQLWHKEIADKNLILSQLSHAPALILFSQKNENDGDTWYQTLSVMALDKQTGRTYIDWTKPAQHGLQTFEINMAERYVELRMYDRRFRLVAVDQVAEAGPAIAPKPGEPKSAPPDGAASAPKP
ncbi:MAG: PQQ-binding-like beta-propeller repeat protein, partial [Planctomycetaceae bacterium]